MNFINKMLLSLLIIPCIIFLLLFIMFSLIKDDKDFCLDSGICAENLQLNTEYGLITINEETCKKYNWKWDSKRRYCNVN